MLIFNWLLRLALSKADYPAVAGDLAEEYHRRVRPTRAWAGAQAWYAGQVLSVVWFSLLDRIRPVRSALPVSEYPAERGGALDVTADITFAFRLFRREPGLFAATIAGLAIAIGVSTAMFSLVRAVAFGDQGVASAESVFRVSLHSGPLSITNGTSGSAMQGNWAMSDYPRLQQNTSLDLAASARTSATFSLLRDGEPMRGAEIRAVSGNYFSLLGLKMTRGRALSGADDVPGAARVIVGEGFWKNRLAADSQIVGRTVWIDNRPFEVIGVADRSVSGDFSLGTPPALWITLSADRDFFTQRAQVQRDGIRAKLNTLVGKITLTVTDQERRQSLTADLAMPVRVWNAAVDVYGRLRPGSSRARAETEIDTIANAIALERGARQTPQVLFRPTNEGDDYLMAAAAILMSVVGLVVLIACANVANLLLASAAGRQREIGTRLALGASRGRIMRQLLSESLLVGIVAGIIGLAIAAAIVPTFAALVTIPPTYDVSPNWVVYAFVTMVTILVGLGAGLAPARYGRRGDLASALASDRLSLSSVTPPTRLRSVLIGAQSAGAMVFLVLVSLFARTVIQNSRADLGFDPAGLLAVYTGNSTNGRVWDETRYAAYWEAALPRLRALPGVANAALTTVTPYGGTSFGRLDGRVLDRYDTSSEYFATVGLSVVRGRTYTADEVRNGAPVAVISASLARAYWGDADPIGSTLERVLGANDGKATDRQGMRRRPGNPRVIGVVSDTTPRLTARNVAAIYSPAIYSNVPQLLVRAHGDPHVLARPVEDVLRSVDPDVSGRTSYVIDGFDKELELPKMLATLAGIVGANALGLTIIGLFGVTAFVVRHRTREISIRRALGASEREVVRMLMRESLTPVAIGLVLGLGIALLGGQLAEGMLFGVSGRDPLAIAAAVVVLLAAALAAVLVPARRAARVNPAQLLKEQ